MLRYKSLIVDDIVTPVNVRILHELLRQTKYDEAETKFLVDGFARGFDTGYRGQTKRQDLSTNIPLRVGTKTDLWNKIMQEVKENRIAGPFDKIPFKYYVQSPVGLVPKNNGKHRLIFHLSYAFKEFKSINEYIPHKWCSVKYNDLDAAVQQSLRISKRYENGPLSYGSMDLFSAYKTRAKILNDHES